MIIKYKIKKKTQILKFKKYFPLKVEINQTLMARPSI